MKKKRLILLLIGIVIIGVLIFSILGKNEDCTIEVKDNNESVEKTFKLFEDDIIGTLTIEKIGLNAPIKDGIDYDILKGYIGHLPESPYFEGNVCLYAHNSGFDNNYFRDLYNLEIGDLVEYSNKYFKSVYKVSDIYIIDEDDMTVLNSSEDNILTMITCVSGSPDKRLCVVAKEGI